MPRLATSAPLLLALLAACGDDLGDGERRLVLFHTNDEHSHLFGFAPELDDYPAPTAPGDGSIVGGIARRAAVLAAERAALDEAGVDHLTVSAGDETQGALPQIAFATSSPDFRLMALLGYDVMCPGNHEFDLGPEAYAAALTAAGAAPQVVSSNIRFSDEPGDDALEALFGAPGSGAPIVPYHVITTGSGLRVGFVGVMGVSASFYAPLKGPVRFSAEPDQEGDQEAVLPRIYADLAPVVAALREQHAVDVLIAVSHSGVDVDQPELGDDYQIARNVAGIDLIVSGHSHTPLDAPMFADGPDGHRVPIVQAGSFGQFLGRAELIVREGERPSIDLDPARTGLRRIDDAIVPRDPQILGALDQLIADLEASALPDQLARIEGAPVADDPDALGDLYFRPMGATDFDVIGLRASAETNLLNLSTDAMLAAAEELAGPTLVAVQAAGNIRDDIRAGRTGALSYADLYRVLPLGLDPTDGSIGYPLTRFHVYTVELKAAFEVGVSRGYVEDSLFLGASGVRVEYDTSRSPQVLDNQIDALDPQNGRVTRILVDVDHDDGVDQPTVVLFDIERTGAEWDSELGNAFTLHPVVTSLYIASFADTAGVTLKNDSGQAVELLDTILRRADGSAVKDYEAFISYVQQISASGLPARYDESAPAGQIPRRLLCTGPLCAD